VQDRPRLDRGVQHAMPDANSMKRNAVLGPDRSGTGTAPGTSVERCPRRLSCQDRRAQLLEIAATQFAITGLRGTTTAALAKAARITEPVLYLHFESKDRLFREVVENNIEIRLRTIDARLASVAHGRLADCIESMAEVTVTACVSDTSNALLTNWALLEAPEYAVDLHRREVGCVSFMWERCLAERFPESRSRGVLSMHLVPYPVHPCLAYGLWLAALRHSPQSAAPLVHHFAARVAQAAAALVPGNKETAAC